MAKHYLKTAAVLALLLSNKGFSQTVIVDPALSAAIGVEAALDDDNHKKTHKLQDKIKSAQAQITAATVFITNWQNKIYKGLTEVNNNVTNAYQVYEVGKVAYSIGDYQVKMVQAARPNPLALAFVVKIETQLVRRALKIGTLLETIVLKAKNENVLMNAGERVAMMNDLLLELRVLEAYSASAYYKVQLVVRQGIIRSLNPFYQMYNDDATIVRQILQRVNF